MFHYIQASLDIFFGKVEMNQEIKILFKFNPITSKFEQNANNSLGSIVIGLPMKWTNGVLIRSIIMTFKRFFKWIFPTNWFKYFNSSRLLKHILLLLDTLFRRNIVRMFQFRFYIFWSFLTPSTGKCCFTSVWRRYIWGNHWLCIGLACGFRWIISFLASFTSSHVL
jgi:hypothetical protein